MRFSRFLSIVAVLEALLIGRPGDVLAETITIGGGSGSSGGGGVTVNITCNGDPTLSTATVQGALNSAGLNGVVTLPACPGSSAPASAPSAATSTTITFASLPPGIAQGQVVLDITNPIALSASTTISSVNTGANTITITPAVPTGAGVATNDLIQTYGYIPYNAQLFIPSNTTLCGQGMGRTWLRQANGANLGTAQNPGQITNSGNTGIVPNGVITNTSITICNLSVDGNQPNNLTPNTAGQGLYFVGVSNFSARNVEVTNVEGEAFDVDGNAAQAAPCDHRNIYVHDTFRTGFHLQHAQRDCITDGVKALNTGGHGIFADASQGIFNNLIAINAGCQAGCTIDGAAATVQKACATSNALTSTGQTAGNNTIPYTTTPSTMQVGNLVVDDTTPGAIPPNTNITFITNPGGAGSITLSNNVTSPGVGAGDRIRTYAVTNPGGGGANQAGFGPCPTGIFLHNVTAKSCNNWYSQNNQFGGIVAIGVRFASCSNWASFQNSQNYPGDFDEVSLDLNNSAPNYGEMTNFNLVGLSVGSNTQTSGDAQGLGANLPACVNNAAAGCPSSPSARYGLFINDGILGSVASATIAAAGTGYSPTSNAVTMSLAGAVCPVTPTFTITASGGIVSKVDYTKAANTSGPGFCTTIPPNPVATSGGGGIGLTLNLTWSNMTITGVTYGDTTLAHSRLPAYTTGLTLQDSDGWVAYTPTVTCGAGAVTTQVVSGRYKPLGKTIPIQVDINITALNTCTGNLIVTLPEVPAKRDPISGLNFTTSTAVPGIIDPTTGKLSLLFGAGPAANQYYAAGTYEAQ